MLGKLKRNMQTQTGRPAKKVAKRSAGKNVTSVTVGSVKKMVSSNIPEYIKSTLRYADVTSIDPGVAGPAVVIYRANSLYDPEVATGGDQPPGFDDYMRLYGRFTVLKARIKVVFACSGTGFPSFNLNVIGIALNTSGSALGDVTNYLSCGDCNWTGIGKDYVTKTLTLEVDVAKYFGQNIWADDVYSGTDSADCARQCYFHIFTQADTDIPAVRLAIEIEYDVAFRTIKTKAFS